MESKSKVIKYLQIMALGVAGGSIYLIPFIRYVFYDWQVEAMGISNMQLGLLSTVYAIGNSILYIPGGIVADKFSTKKCMLISLISTSILTFVFAFSMGSFTFAIIVWTLFAVTGTFLFWCALMKTIRLISGEQEQGFMFGLYYMCNGLTGAIVNTIALQIAANGADATSKFFIAVVVYGGSTTVAAILIALLLKDNKGKDVEVKSDEFHFNQVGGLLKNPNLWLFAIVAFTGYSIYSSSSYFTPYLTDVIGISPESSGYLSIIRTYIFYIVSPLSGILADKVFKSTSKWFMMLFAVLTVLFAGIFLIPPGASVGMVSFYTLLPGLFGLALYGLVFSVVNETKISPVVMGTAVGIASIIGYSPDFFMAAMFGSWLDKYGSDGYNYIFIFLTVVCVLGLVAAAIIRKNSKNMNTDKSGAAAE
ncbi:MAG: MFS transporter [Muricomes sp.]